MKRLKKIGIIYISVTGIICLALGYYINQNWIYRYNSELDQFFGEGNWEYISKETRESPYYSKYIVSRNPIVAGEEPGKFHNWYILFNDKYGEEEISLITDHPLKINNDKYWIFSSNRLTKRQALYLELMHISFDVVGKKLFNEMIRSELSENEAYPIDVSISYNGGNPNPKFYDSLSKEKWFTVDKITAEDYLTYDLHDFYIRIRAFDYRLDHLTNEERQNVFDSLEIFEKKLLETYGEDASFEIYFDKEHQVEYINGRQGDGSHVSSRKAL